MIVSEGKNGIRREVATGTGRDENICVATDVATVVIEDLEVGVACAGEITQRSRMILALSLILPPACY